MLSCAMTASYIASAEKKKIEQTEAFIALVKYIKNQIDCYSMPMEKILHSCPELLLRLGIEKEISSLSELLSECEIVCGEDCKKILYTFSESFGKGYREHQVKRCDAAVTELEEIKKRLGTEYPSKKKTAAALCFAVGGALLIALL